MRARAIGLLAAAVVLAPVLSACAASLSRQGGVAEANGHAVTPVVNTVGSPNPLPGRTIISQIHNAPGWLPSHLYRPANDPATRVANGPGWDPASGSYHPGLPLDAYQLVSAAPCRSAAGGGPQGNGTVIKDGDCTWKYVSPVDYISITGWAFDNAPWQRGSHYHYFDHVTAGSPLRAYALVNEGCTSTAEPAGTGNVRTDDGCQWEYLADILYTSRKSYIPTETFTARNSAATLHLRGNYEAELWNDREYIAGQHGETAPIRLQSHDDFRQEGGVILGCTNTPCYHLIITTAPGESFRDSLSPADPLSGYDPTRGVAIRNSLPYRWPYEPAGLDIHDNFVDLIGLQVKSVHGDAVNGMSSFGNVMSIRDCILDGGSNDQWTSHAAVTTDTSSVIANSLVIARGPVGIVFKYPGFVLHTTIVHPSRPAGSVGIETVYRWVFPDSTVSNTAIFGFSHAVAHGRSPTAWSERSSHNITDAPQGDSGVDPSTAGMGLPATIDTLPGTIYGAKMAGVFMQPGSDWRLTSHSPLRGAGSAFGAFAIGCTSDRPDCVQRRVYGFDSPDIIGTVRPQAGRYDIGAWQSVATPATRGRSTARSPQEGAVSAAP